MENSVIPTLNTEDENWITKLTYAVFLISVAVCGVLQYFVWKIQSNAVSANNQDFRQFQKKYFSVYFMVLFGDWLQGPYVYKLYSHYGFVPGQISILYVVGFTSSVLFGTATGVLADYFGRKKMCMVFCVTYSLCCWTKMSANYNLLLLGRLLGGISTSLLFSVFESWYVYEHIQKYDFPREWISTTYSMATFWNGVLAILAGVVANVFADFFNFGPVSPFILAIPFFLFSCLFMSQVWCENYGKKQANWFIMCNDGLRVIFTNPLIFLLGIVQSLFESVMYIFVFLWTPVLDVGKAPLGMIFASFMVCIMLGSSIYQLLMDRKFHAQQLLLISMVIATSSLSGCALATSYKQTNLFLAFISFLLLELAIGIYYPAIGYLKSQYIPESHRANIMNWFRVPLNIITSVVLLWLHGRSEMGGTYITGTYMIFLFCTGLMLCCALITLRLLRAIYKSIPVTEQV